MKAQRAVAQFSYGTLESRILGARTVSHGGVGRSKGHHFCAVIEQWYIPRCQSKTIPFRVSFACSRLILIKSSTPQVFAVYCIFVIVKNGDARMRGGEQRYLE